jgi:ribosomal protein S18 acetylase RimI-like enzyme
MRLADRSACDGVGDADDVDAIGLNVRRDNAPAIRCYEHLGFRPVLAYEEGVAARD